MRRKLYPAVVLSALLTALAGCGSGARVATVNAAAGNPSATTATSTRATDSGTYVSDRYCQMLAPGRWVTNIPNSQTACVPKPSYATGDEQADGSVALPRCFTCRRSDWERAEKRRHNPAATDDDQSTTENLPRDGWSLLVRNAFAAKCSAFGGDTNLCACLTNQLEYQIPADDVSILSVEDPRVRGAVRRCQS